MLRLPQKKVNIFIMTFFIIALAFLAVFGPSTSKVYDENKNLRSHFGVFNYETIGYFSKPRDKAAAEDLMYQIYDALNFAGSREKPRIQPPYDQLCVYKNEVPIPFVEVDAKVNFITFSRKFKHGCLWFTYTVERRDLQGKLLEDISQTEEVLGLLKAKFIDDKWVGTELILAPES